MQKAAKRRTKFTPRAIRKEQSWVFACLKMGKFAFKSGRS